MIWQSASLLVARTNSSMHQQLCHSQEALFAANEKLKYAQEKCTKAKEQLEYIIIHTGRFGSNQHLENMANVQKTKWGMYKDKQEVAEKELKEKTDAVKSIQGKADGGPCAASLEAVLQQHGIQRQAYHGGAFEGNHVHKGLQEKVFSDLCSAPAHVISKRAEASAEGASAGQRDQVTCLVQAATVVKDRYVSLFSKFAACFLNLQLVM